MSQDNTATQGTNATQAGVTRQDTSTKQVEIESSRAFKKVEAKTFSIAPAGVFNAVVIEVAFIGTYTRTFTKGKETTSRDYEFVGFAFKFIDLNTGVENIIYSEVALTYVDGSRLRGYIDGLNPDFKEGDALKKLLSGKCNITITHTQGKDKSGEAKTYANIVNIVEHNKNMPDVPVDRSELQYFDILNDMAKIEEGLNSKHRWLIQNKSHEYGSNASSVDAPAPAEQAQPQEDAIPF
ncbi:MAG: hypothetical protein KAH03_08280 [Cocleimonas sp.]|nr:hypothetical protein [Cocleimonas sp.]